MKKIYFLLLILQGFWFTASAQVGIGTSSPHLSSILELKSSTKGLLFPRTSSTTRVAMAGAKGLMVYDTTVSKFYFHNGSVWVEMMSGGQPNHWSEIQDYEDLVNTNGSGNVVIGPWNGPSPGRLSVHGTLYVRGNTETIIKLGGLTSTTTEAKVSWELPSNNRDYNITQWDDHFYISRTLGQPGFLNDFVMEPQSGWIGIGIDDPATRLHIVGGTDVGNASGGFIQMGASNDLNIGIDNNEIQARLNGAVNRLHLNNGGGTVQIGNAVAPTTYSLAVNGRVICEELKIQASSNWADYVFAEDYSLKSFDELRRYIDTHNHLPNIPDAASVEKNGIEIGDMQKRMMEKIEELTLYILQLEEKSREHEREIAALKLLRP